MVMFRPRVVLDPDGNVHINPLRVSQYSIRLKRSHAPFLFAVTVILMAVALYFAITERRFEKRAISTQAVVVRIDSRVPRATKNARMTERTQYRRVLSFTDSLGHAVEIEENTWSSKQPTVGERSPILYDPENPGDAKSDSLFERYGISILLTIISFITLGLGLLAYFVNPERRSGLTIDGKTWTRTDGIPAPATRATAKSKPGPA